MNTRRVMVADASVEFCDALEYFLDNRFDLKICHDGQEAETALESYSPDVLVMDLTLPTVDGITLLNRISAMSRRPRILVTTFFTSPYVEHVISGFGVDMVMLKPCNIRALVDHVRELSEIREEASIPIFRRRKSAASMLLDLDIPSKRRGFIYLEMCIEMYAEDPGLPLTKVVYPAVAKRYNAKLDAVERAMRQVIHETWLRCDQVIWKRYFHCTQEGGVPRPTNGEFISRLAEILRQRMRENE